MEKTLKIEYHLVDHCNLNCVCCEHFSSISDEFYAEIDTLVEDFKRLSLVVGKENLNLYLLGGEPLLHPNLIEILNKVRCVFPDTESVNIRLVTNGLLLLKMPSAFWEACHRNSITLSVTKYPINLDYVAIEETSKSYGVSFEIFHVTTTAFMRMMPIDIQGENDPSDSFEHCPIAHRCCYLKGSRLFSCPRIPNINAFNKQYGYDLTVSENDYLELGEGVTRAEVYDFLDKHNDFCRYCNADKLNNKVAWKVHSKAINEWVE